MHILPRLILCFMLLCGGLTCKAQDEDDDIDTIKGIKPTTPNCNMFYENEWWLPDAYVINASCACISTPDEPKANIIRQVLRERLESTPKHIKDTAKKVKQLYEDNKITKRAYRRFILSVLTPVFYIDHVIAYRTAKCPSDPSAYWTWKIASTRQIKNCRIIWFGARYFGGSCYGTWGKW